MHPVYLYTLYFASHTTTFLHATLKHLYQMFRNYFIYSQALFNSVGTASPLGSDGSHPGHSNKCSRRRNRPVNKNFSRVPRPGFEPTASGCLIGRHKFITTRLKGPDQLNWSIMHPIYLYTLYFAIHTTTACI